MYRMYPNDQQEALLKSTLVHLCDLYSCLRSKMVSEYKEHNINLSRTDLKRMALESRLNDPDLRKIHSQVVQNVADRISDAFNNYFEKRPRFPRVRKYQRTQLSKVRSESF